MFFFFQAEDGIRDLVRSRGLGDVYKRQAGSFTPGGALAVLRTEFVVQLAQCPACPVAQLPHPYPVSYTHLTLPTIYSV